MHFLYSFLIFLYVSLSAASPLYEHNESQTTGPSYGDPILKKGTHSNRMGLRKTQEPFIPGFESQGFLGINKCSEGFAGSTLIQTPIGPRAIKDVKIGDAVYCWNGYINDTSTVIAVEQEAISHCIVINTKHMQLYVGCCQLFGDNRANQWLEAYALLEHAPPNVQELFPDLLSIEYSNQPVVLYRICVAPHHVYYLDYNNLLVHNFIAESAAFYTLASGSTIAGAIAPPVLAVATVGYASVMLIKFIKAKRRQHRTAPCCTPTAKNERSSGTCGTHKQQQQPPVPPGCLSPTSTNQANSGICPPQDVEQTPIVGPCLQNLPQPQHNQCEIIDSTAESMLNKKNENTPENIACAKSNSTVLQAPATQSTNPYGPNFVHAGPHGTYQDAGYHTKHGNNLKSPRPKNGQAALDNSIPYDTEKDEPRIGVSEGEVVMLRITDKNVKLFHGYVIEWSTLRDNIQQNLIKAGLVNKKGNPLK